VMELHRLRAPRPEQVPVGSVVGVLVDAEAVAVSGRGHPRARMANERNRLRRPVPAAAGILDGDVAGERGDRA
jgi:hypothetical protein